MAKNQSKEQRCHRCKVCVADLCNEQKIIVEYPICKKCIRECLTKAWGYLIENRVFTNRGVIKNYNNEEIFECFLYADALLGYDCSPDKPLSSNDLFGKGRWKIVRHTIGFSLATIIISLVIFLSNVIGHLNYWYDFFRVLAFFSLPVFGFIAIVVYGRLAYFIRMLELREMTRDASVQ